jgi:hypothetical protein
MRFLRSLSAANSRLSCLLMAGRIGMQNKYRSLFILLAGIPGVFLLTAAIMPGSGYGPAGSTFNAPRQAGLLSRDEKISSCLSLLMDAAKQAGIKGTARTPNDYALSDGSQECAVDFAEYITAGTEYKFRHTIYLRTPSPTNKDLCHYTTIGNLQATTFHGYQGVFEHKESGTITNNLASTRDYRLLGWCMYKGGGAYYFGVETISESVEQFGPAQDPSEIAGIVLSLAEQRLPLVEASGTDIPQSVEPTPTHQARSTNTGGIIGVSPSAVPRKTTPQTVKPTPTHQTGSTDTGGNIGIPPLIILGSLGIPVAGAVTGSVLASLLSLLGTRAIPGNGASGTVPPTGKPNGQGLYWSERPWDEAGPGYVTREEFERTKGFLERGYRWTKDGWQTPDEIRQSDQFRRDNRAAVDREADARRVQMEQDRINAVRKQPAAADGMEPPPQQKPAESGFTFELGADGGLSGDMRSPKMSPGVSANVTLYKNQYYDAKDVLGDIRAGGVDIGNYKADVQVGRVQAGAGVGYDAESKSYSAGGSFTASSYTLTGEGVVGNQYAGATADAQIDGPKMEGFVGLKDGSVGGSIGGSLVSAEAGVGMNVANVNVGAHGGISFGLELGLKVGKETEVKLGPFKFGISIGAAKTGL